LFTWGSNSNGQLGANTATGTANSSPVQIGSSSWTVVGAGGVFTTAIRSGGTLFSTGYNPGGTQTSSPVQLGSSSWTAVSGGNAHVLAIRSDNALFAWGFNGNGQTGGGSGASPTTQIFGSGGESLFTNISAGVSFSTAIRSGGTLFTCGGAQGNSEDMLGRKMHEKNPVSITPDKSWAVLSCGTLNASSGAIRSDGLLFTWGPSFYGSIADGTNTGKSSPVQIGSSSWTAVSMRSATNAAIRSDGTLFTWGFNSNGQVGDGTTTVKSSPVQIGSSSWTAVSCGSSHIAAIRSGGTLFTWGSNSNGQLGLNQSTTISNSSPVQVGSSSWIAISAGKNGALAIRSDRMLFAWGFGYNGQIGDGTNTTKSSPVQIGSSLWTAIRAGTGNETSMGLTVANTLFAWGSNGYGQIGDGTDTRRLSPVQIGAAGAWAALGGTGQMSGAIRKT
jgi:alpha-tubulin suppressor-like RCC1 family protein